MISYKICKRKSLIKIFCRNKIQYLESKKNIIFNCEILWKKYKAHVQLIPWQEGKNRMTKQIINLNKFPMLKAKKPRSHQTKKRV